MLVFVLRRITASVPIIIGATILTFSLIHLAPGDPAISMLGPMANQAALQTIRAELHLQDPLPVQYLRWVSRAARGDLGNSIFFRRPVTVELGERLGPAFLLASASFFLILTAGLAIGAVAGLKSHARWEGALTAIISMGVAIPPFVLGLLLLVVFSLSLGWLPSGGIRPTTGPATWATTLQYLLLPAIALAAAPTAVVARMTRASVIETLGQDHIRTARAKGLKPRRIILWHVMRNAIIPVIHILGLELGYVFGAAALVEIVFAWPGLGSLLVRAVVTRDLPLVQGCVLLLAVLYVGINLITDILHGFADPRVRTR
ncbi:MAG: ABC transporter permease [Ardenticatenaceae bacterium]|nr:ABC transporter permease [Ardenticatenaceae bacterium]